MKIDVTYSAIDGARKRKSFDDIAAAREFAVYWIGRNPDIGCGYAISGDGVGKIQVAGCTLAELFAEPKPPAAKLANDPFWVVAGQWYPTQEAAAKESRELFEQGYGERRNPTDEFISAYRVEGPYLPSEVYGWDEP